MMRILVACECSGRIRDAFRENGHDAWSCDLKPDENNKSKYHIQDDVLNHLDKEWDMLIGHPVCTYLCRNRATLTKKEGRKIDTKLFMTCECECHRENPDEPGESYEV